MRKTRRLTRREVEKEPFQIWNAFIDLIALEEYDDLSPTQRLAHLVFWYESEVQNGGHFQYFINSAGARRHDAVVALGRLGLSEQAAVLSAAIETWEGTDRDRPATIEDFAEEALEGEFDDADSRFHSCTPTIVDALQRYLDSHQDEFLVIE